LLLGYANDEVGSEMDANSWAEQGAFYQSFGMPIAKCFLGAIFTYQVVYWSWMKLESLEERKDTEGQ
jgi:hypothetical protein